jgi:predicted nucleic acid-binding protein
MAGAEPIYSWDTCLFLAWIKDEQRKSGEMDGVREVIARARQRNVKIVTSVMTMVEVLQSKLPVGMDRLFTDMMKRVHRIGVDTKVAAPAHDIRDHFVQKSAEFGGKTLSAPDAVHLATAILYRATEFHTFDDGGSSSKSIGLLSLSGNVGGHKLTICKPMARNPSLDLRRPPSGTTPNNPNGS